MRGLIFSRLANSTALAWDSPTPGLWTLAWVVTPVFATEDDVVSVNLVGNPNVQSAELGRESSSRFGFNFPGHSLYPYAYVYLTIHGRVTKTWVIDGLNDMPGQSPQIDRARRERCRDVAKANLAMVAAPDGHAVLVQVDTSGTWHYVGLDVGERPLYCRHHPITFHGSWDAVPTSEGLILEALIGKPSHGHLPWPTGTGRIHSIEGAQEQYSLGAEWRAIMAYAGDHLAKDEVKAAWESLISRDPDPTEHGCFGVGRGDAIWAWALKLSLESF